MDDERDAQVFVDLGLMIAASYQQYWWADQQRCQAIGEFLAKMKVVYDVEPEITKAALIERIAQGYGFQLAMAYVEAVYASNPPLFGESFLQLPVDLVKDERSIYRRCSDSIHDLIVDLPLYVRWWFEDHIEPRWWRIQDWVKRHISRRNK